jgi:hypothetical protein
LAERELGRDTHQDMRMILIGVHLMNDNLRMVSLDFSYFELEVVGHTAREDLASVFGRDDKVVPGVEDGVTEPVVLHTLIVLEKTANGLHPRPTGRGIAGELIKILGLISEDFYICNRFLVDAAGGNWNYVFEGLIVLCERLEELDAEAIIEGDNSV